MGTKRPFADVDPPPGADQAADRQPSANAKRRKQFGKGRHKAKEGTSEFAKKRVRNIERLLQRNQDLPADVRNELGRELAAHKADIADKAFQKRRMAMISKYHMVRFFERKKASRLVKQLKRQVEENPDSEDVDRLKRDLHVAEVDEAYTLYHPHIEPYISLYGSARPAEADEGAIKTPAAKIALKKAERPPMWSVVEMTMEEGPAALKRLREQRPVDEPAGHKPQRRPQKASANTSSVDRKQQQQHPSKGRQQQGGKANSTKGKGGAQPQLNRRERRRLMHQATAAADDSDGDGDGGFFEEL